ncbi:hypothetical protein EVAR_74597_1 [Eumeta japonica]|uniref:Uncharacterized protein n=1 Tax=Eumeta variegata TaxID=151549 RepID=A0A4C1WC88_EUMVA|nr:hypothetical protein EVAR_74597_1 [Eumeta japonica]
MSVFDPLGLASPVLIGQMHAQDIWRSGIDWDETIEADAQEVAKMGERHKAGIDQNTSMHIARPHRGSYMCSSTRAKSRTLRPSILDPLRPTVVQTVVAHRLAELEEHDGEMLEVGAYEIERR